MILSLQARIEDLNELQLKLKEALKTSKARENNLTEDLENLNQELRTKQKTLNKLQKEKDEVDKENEELKKRVKRLMSSVQVHFILFLYIVCWFSSVISKIIGNNTQGKFLYVL